MPAPVEYSFRDAELRSRPLRALNRLGGFLARAGRRVPSLAPASLEAAAVARAGSDDFGSDSHREPLGRFVRAVEDEADLTTFGRLAVRGMLTGALANRIRLHEWARAHPEVRGEAIERPWVIVGLPRTGTTLLSILLGLDPASRAPLQWEATHPVPPATLATAATDPRVGRKERELAQLHRLNPAFAAMHPTGAALAEECVAFFLYDVRTLAVETQAYVPSYGRWLQACDMAPAYEQHRLALQVLQAAQPTERWVLKTPNHLWCLATLLAFYPDARIIWTHRDPGPVVASVASLVNALQRTFTRRTDPRPAAEDWKAKLHHAIRCGMAWDDSAASGWCHHLHYADLVGDPVAAVSRLYAHFGETVSPLHRRRMEAWMRERPQTAHGRHVYDAADYGWTWDGLAREFADYARRYDIPRERPSGS